MQTISILLIVIGLAIIAAVLLMRWRLRRGRTAPVSPPPSARTHDDPVDYDPLFAIDQSAERGRGLDEVGRVLAEPLNTAATDSAPAPVIVAASEPPPSHPRTVPPRRSAPRVATDPERVIAMNVMAPDGQRFSGPALAAAAQRAGLELGAWSIYHYYSKRVPEAPPLFSMANMVKPGSFDPQRLHEIDTVGLSLFMVPADDEGDIPAFDMMLATARQLASELGGEVRDARRSVLTRQAIDHLREQLSEWRRKARAAQS